MKQANDNREKEIHFMMVDIHIHTVMQNTNFAFLVGGLVWNRWVWSFTVAKPYVEILMKYLLKMFSKTFKMSKPILKVSIIFLRILVLVALSFREKFSYTPSVKKEILGLPNRAFLLLTKLLLFRHNFFSGGWVG